jgi:hypothetical protein
VDTRVINYIERHNAKSCLTKQNKRRTLDMNYIIRTNEITDLINDYKIDKNLNLEQVDNYSTRCIVNKTVGLTKFEKKQQQLEVSNMLNKLVNVTNKIENPVKIKIDLLTTILNNIYFLETIDKIKQLPNKIFTLKFIQVYSTLIDNYFEMEGKLIPAITILLNDSQCDFTKILKYDLITLVNKFNTKIGTDSNIKKEDGLCIHSILHCLPVISSLTIMKSDNIINMEILTSYNASIGHTDVVVQNYIILLKQLNKIRNKGIRKTYRDLRNKQKQLSKLTPVELLIKNHFKDEDDYFKYNTETSQVTVEMIKIIPLTKEEQEILPKWLEDLRFEKLKRVWKRK